MSAGAFSAAVGAEEPATRYIVVLRDDVKGPAQVAEEHVSRFQGSGLSAVYRHALKGYAAEFSEDELKALKKDPRVDYVEPDPVLETTAQTTPAGISRIFAASNSKLFINQTKDKWADVDVAVLDTGVDRTHPELNVYRRADCLNSGGECTDEAGDPGTFLNSYHGTAVAGVIAADDNGDGVVGVAHGARIWSAKVVPGCAGCGLGSDYLKGLDWVKAHADEIEVINSSLKFEEKLTSFDEMQEKLNAAGVIHIAAAGNDNEKVKYQPAVSDLVVTVSGIADFDGKSGGAAAPKCNNFDDQRFVKSNYGEKVDIAAPAVCVLTTTYPGGGYADPTGTSFAAPHVAGAAALLAMQIEPDSNADVEWIKKTLEEEGNFGWVDTSPDGIKEPLLDVGNSVLFDMQVPPHAKTGGFSELQAMSAALHGSVNPRNDSTTYQFEYGPTTAYGGKSPASAKSAGSGLGAITVEEPLAGLTPATTYHYRLVATNPKGTDLGEDRTFTTPKVYVPRFDAESHPATVSGEQMSINPLKFKFDGNTIACSGVETTSSLAHSSARLVSSASHTGCTQGESAATIDMKSCSYVFGVANSGPPYAGSLGISCTTAGDAIEISVPGCLLKLFPQTVNGAVSYANVGAGSERQVGVNVSTKSLTYKRTGGICIFLGAEGSNGELAGTIKLSATNASAEPAGIYLTGGGASGLALAGEGSPEPSKQPRFEANAYPAPVVGEQSALSPLKFNLGGTVIACAAAELDSQLTGAAGQLTALAKFSGCTQGESAATIDMKSCSYVFGVANSGPPYTGSLGISCTTAGDSIEVSVPGCTYKLFPQTVSGAVGYANEGTGAERFVRATVSTKSLTYKRTGGICIFLGAEGTNGELAGEVEAYGFG